MATGGFPSLDHVPEFGSGEYLGTPWPWPCLRLSVAQGTHHQCTKLRRDRFPREKLVSSFIPKFIPKLILIFPEGEDDAVTITGSDLEGLKPMSFLSTNIIDFYIKFLERRLSSEDRERFYFFNSFFFIKLLGDNRSIAHECGVDFDQVRSWTGEVNLFEKE